MERTTKRNKTSNESNVNDTPIAITSSCIPANRDKQNLILDHTTVRTGCTSTNSSIIKKGEFSSSKTLEMVKILESSTINCIGDRAFFLCRLLRFIEIPENVTNIGKSAFASCKLLQSINIPNGVTTIGEYAFYGCRSLHSIHIPNSVRTIGRNAFCECTSLQSIYIPNSVPHSAIARWTFYGCASLERRRKNGINYHEDTETWLRRRFDNLPIHKVCHEANNTSSLWPWSPPSPSPTTSLKHFSKLIQENKQALTVTDAMGMTPLHILCCNKRATVEMMRVVVDGEPSVQTQTNVTNNTPLELFLKCRSLLGAGEDSNIRSMPMPTLHYLLERGIRCDDLDILSSVLENQEMDLSRVRDESTGLLPFMLAANSLGCGLDVVYGLAMDNVDAII